MEQHLEIDDGPLYSKLHKVWCCPSLCIPCNFLWHPCRKAVSRKKKRYEKDGFDLDLVYMTNRIIVHGFPATGIEHIYRNPRYEIRRLLDTYHDNHYRIYNFCCEPGRGYPAEVFHGNVRRYPFKDHNTPPLSTLVGFANDAKGWLDQNENNVCSLHCKAGKGRAGLMCCVLLVRTGTCQSALEAMDYYDLHRVENNRGLTVTSQRKYVIFYEMLWRQYWGVTGDIGQIPAIESMENSPYVLPHEPQVRIIGIQLLGSAISTINGLQMKIYQGTNFKPHLVCPNGILETEINSNKAGTRAGGGGGVPNKWKCDCEVKGNFKIYISRQTYSGEKKLFELWHNTLFLEIDPVNCTADLAKDQIDIKRKLSSHLGDDLRVRIFFGEIQSVSVGSSTPNSHSPISSHQNLIPSSKSSALSEVELNINERDVELVTTNKTHGNYQEVSVREEI